MENYQRKRLQPLAFLVIGLVLTPLAIAPAAQMMQSALSDSQETPITFTKTVRQSPDITVPPTTITTPASVTTASETLEGMTLDAPIRPLHPCLSTKSLV